MCLPGGTGSLDFMTPEFIPVFGSHEKSTKLLFSSGRREHKIRIHHNPPAATNKILCSL